MIALILAAALQQDAAHLARQLGDDDVERRDAAEKALVAMGPAALPHVRPLLTSDDPEVAVRAANIVRAIETAERRRAVRGEVQRVTVRAKSFHEALKAIDPRLAEGVSDKPLDFDAEGLPLWEALDKLARAHGGVDFVSEPTGETKEIHGMTFPVRAIKMLQRPIGAKPTRYVGPYRVRVEKVSNERHWITWGSLGDAGPRVALRVDVPPNAYPVAGEGFGEFRLAAPADGKVGSISKLTYAVASESCVFEGWDAAAGREETLGPFKATFCPEKCDGAHCQPSFKIDRQDDAPALIDDDFQKHVDAWAVSADGKTRVAAGLKGYTPGRNVVFFIPHRDDVGHGRIEVRMITEWFTEDVPFEFEDVSIPQF